MFLLSVRARQVGTGRSVPRWGRAQAPGPGPLFHMAKVPVQLPGWKQSLRGIIQPPHASCTLRHFYFLHKEGKERKYSFLQGTHGT